MDLENAVQSSGVESSCNLMLLSRATVTNRSRSFVTEISERFQRGSGKNNA